MDINFYFSCKVFAFLSFFFSAVDHEFIGNSIFYFIVRPDSIFFFSLYQSCSKLEYIDQSTEL